MGTVVSSAAAESPAVIELPGPAVYEVPGHAFHEVLKEKEKKEKRKTRSKSEPRRTKNESKEVQNVNHSTPNRQGLIWVIFFTFPANFSKYVRLKDFNNIFTN